MNRSGAKKCTFLVHGRCPIEFRWNGVAAIVVVVIVVVGCGAVYAEKCTVGYNVGIFRLGDSIYRDCVLSAHVRIGS